MSRRWRGHGMRFHGDTAAFSEHFLQTKLRDKERATREPEQPVIRQECGAQEPSATPSSQHVIHPGGDVEVEHETEA